MQVTQNQELNKQVLTLVQVVVAIKNKVVKDQVQRQVYLKVVTVIQVPVVMVVAVQVTTVVEVVTLKMEVAVVQRILDTHK